MRATFPSRTPIACNQFRGGYANCPDRARAAEAKGGAHPRKAAQGEGAAEEQVVQDLQMDRAREKMRSNTAPPLFRNL